MTTLPIRRISLVVLDLVGTTVRAGDEVPRVFRDVLGEEGIHLADEALEGVRGRSKREAIELLLREATGAPVERRRVDAVHLRFQEELRREYRSRAAPIPGAGSALRALRRRGAVVLSTGLDRATAHQLVATLGWESVGLTGVVTGDDVERGRPAPDLIHAAMELASLDDPAAVATVGDTAADLLAGAAASVRFNLGVLSGAHDRPRLEAAPHTALLGSVAELPSWLEENDAWPSRPGDPPERAPGSPG